MIQGILGKKISMTQIFKGAEEAIPVSVLEAGPCVVLQVKTPDKDGYTAVQLGYDSKKESLVNRPDMGKFKRIKATPVSFVKELRVDEIGELKAADKITVEMFEVGEYVDVTGTSIGKGFQGGMKRWNWHGGPGSHGSNSHRAPGSVGATDAARVFKGHPLPGQMGNENVTVQGLEVVDVDKENNLLVVKGAVPGKRNNYLIIKKSCKKTKRDLEAEKKKGHKKALNPLKQSKKSMKK